MHSVHLFSGDNNLGPFHIRLREIALKHPEKSPEIFCPENFYFTFYWSKNALELQKMVSFQYRKVASFYKYNFAAIWIACRTESVLDTKVQNSAF